MTLTFEIDGRLRSVSIEPVGAVGASGGRFRITVDDVSEEVDVSLSDLGLLLMFSDGRIVDAALTERAIGEWLVQLPHSSVTARLDRGTRHASSAGPQLEGEQRVIAPMPGRVLRVLVKPGDEVGEGQGLVVVEAMKMENELSSPKTGRVKEVAVSEGESIDAGRLLVVVE